MIKTCNSVCLSVEWILRELHIRLLTSIIVGLGELEGAYDGAVGGYAREVGVYAGEVGVYAGEVGVYDRVDGLYDG
jgi:hypothetical protein